MTAVLSTTQSKSLASKAKIPERGITFPLRANVIAVKHGGSIGVIFPKPIVKYLNLATDWSAFDISICERGLRLELIDKRNLDNEFKTKKTKAGGRSNAAFYLTRPRPVFDGEMMTKSNSRALGFSTAEGLA